MRIATRGSPLAMAQARAVAEALGGDVQLVPIRTAGDRIRTALAAAGGKGLFTAELERALRAREVHLAVHSAKDLPATLPDDLIIAAVPAREDPRDALVSPSAAELAGLPAGARVGTGSLRRAVLVRQARSDVSVLALRGNVGTRLRKLRSGEFEAIIVALAGLKRLGLLEELTDMVRPLSVSDFVPAAGQGALAVQCLANDAQTRRRLETINHPDSAAALSAEREVVRHLGASCRSAVGAYVWREDTCWLGLALAADPKGSTLLRARAEAASPDAAAAALLRDLQRSGADRLFRCQQPPAPPGA